MQCRLCRAPEPSEKYRIGMRRYFECAQCRYLFMNAEAFLPQGEEESRYLQHNNTRENQGYCDFLTPAAQVIARFQAAPAHGLDYGCGPGPVLSEILQEAGYTMDLYDPYFHPVSSWAGKSYDFLTCTEAAEHFHQPRLELERMKLITKTQAPIVWMTEIWQGQGFEKWYYKNDPTHVGFFSATTLQWIADFLERDLKILDRNLLVFHGR